MIVFGAEENPLFNPVNTDNIWLTALASRGWLVVGLLGDAVVA